MQGDIDFLKQISSTGKENDMEENNYSSEQSSDNLESSMRSSKYSMRTKSRRAQSIVKKNFVGGIKAKNIYAAVQEISESEFLNQIEGDINQKNSRYKHLKHDLKKMHRKAKTLSKYMQMEQLKNSPTTYKNLKKINQTNIHSSNETTQLINVSRVSSSGLQLSKSIHQMKINAKSQILKKSPNLNEDSIFSILGMEVKNKHSFAKEKIRNSIFIDPMDHNSVRFNDNTKKIEKAIPKKWRLEKVDFITKNSNFSHIVVKKEKEQTELDSARLDTLGRNTFLSKKNMNKIDRFRKIFIIYGNFNKFCPIKVTQILLPIYSFIFDKQSLRTDLTTWFEKAKELLGVNSELHHLFLINGTPIDYLCEIPDECNVVIVDIFGKCNFWINVLKFHKISILSKAKINFLMHFLNSRKETKEIILFLNDRNKFQTIKNEIEGVFEKFQGDDGLTDLKKSQFQTSKKLKYTVLDCLDYMENNYLKNLDLTNCFGATKDKMIEDYYNRVMEQTLTDIYHKINEISNEEFCKVPPNDIEAKYLIDENKLSADEKAIVGRKLSFLLKSYELTFKKEVRKDNMKSVENELKHETIMKSHKKNYINENIDKVSKKWDKIVENLEKRYPSLFQLNLPKIESEYIFTRFELHNFYTKYKSLIHLNALDLNNIKYDVDQGIDINTFRKGLSENFASAHEELIHKMFSMNNTSPTMKWSQYLNILNSVRAKTLQSKLDLFFKLMDSDGNGQLSYSEIKYLCFQTLKKLLESSDEEFVEDLAQTFTKFVFEAVGLSMDEEIEVEVLKDFMVNNSHSDEVDLLLMMCCAEKNQDDKFLEDSIRIEDSVYIEEAADNHLRQKAEYFVKEENRLSKMLKFDPENKKIQRRSSIIKTAKLLNFEKEKERHDETSIEKKKAEDDLMEKLKNKAEEKKIKIMECGGDEHEIFEEAFATTQMKILKQRQFQR